jgi:hypothetical protein
MKKSEALKLCNGNSVFVCTGKQHNHYGERPGFMAFVVSVTPRGGVLVERLGVQTWHPYSMVYRQELHYRDRHLRPRWAQQNDEEITF